MNKIITSASYTKLDNAALKNKEHFNEENLPNMITGYRKRVLPNTQELKIESSDRNQCLALRSAR